MKRGPTIEPQAKEKNLQHVIDSGDIAGLQQLINDGCDINSYPAIGKLLVHFGHRAAGEELNEVDLSKSIKMLRFLMENGADIEKQNNGLTPIFHAIMVDIVHNTVFTQIILEESNPKASLRAQCAIKYDNIDDEIEMIKRYHPNQYLSHAKGIALKEALELVSKRWVADATPFHAILLQAKSVAMDRGDYFDRQKTIQIQKRLFKLLLCHCVAEDGEIKELTLKDSKGVCINDVLNTKKNIENNVIRNEQVSSNNNFQEMFTIVTQSVVDEFLNNTQFNYNSIEKLVEKLTPLVFAKYADSMGEATIQQDGAVFQEANKELREDYETFFNTIYRLSREGEVKTETETKKRPPLPNGPLTIVASLAIEQPDYMSSYELYKRTNKMLTEMNHRRGKEPENENQKMRQKLDS